ncbi:TonB-dependent receptor [Occallatibacter riparius]|uniref:TonB-dependent receptor n=1 Tax=Occallatibacter riparius TaxID=1002689 RepID=A0A9J7BUQ9_9BACT|nr:TonB-dependent receptor [Occallatibacter riparius]UWZ86305.1 TonB-dependent receptor [Occallatibacter riparius]
MSGTVLDPSGAAIPGASVSLTNAGTQQTQTSTTNDTGFFHFGELSPGNYTITVTANGFKKNVMKDIGIVAETPRNVNVHLETGGAVETVEINANEGPQLQTADASIGSTISTEEVTRLPIVGGDPYELIRTAPGITGDAARSSNGSAVFLPNGAGPGGSNKSVFQTENAVQISADGQRQADNNFMIDGVSVNSLTHGGNAVVTPNEEAVGQMTVVSTSYDASDGRNTGAQIKVVTKSGTNSLHGGAFFLYDQPGLNAYNKYAGPAGLNGVPQRVENAQRTWAASLGGPAVKDKLFWFASWSGFTLHNSSIDNVWVETPEFRSLIAQDRPGGLSAEILSLPGMAPRVVSVLNSDCSDYANNQGQYPGQTATGGPFCQPTGSGIDVGSPTPGGASQLGQYPRLSYGADPTNNVVTGGGLDGIPDMQLAAIRSPNQARGNQFNARGDWNITGKDLLAGTVYFTKLDSNGPSGTNGARPADDVPFKPLNSAATAIYIHTFSPTWLNEFRANMTRFAENGVVDGGNQVDWGIPYINVQTMPFSNNPQYGVNWSQTTPAVFAENTYEVRDMVTHTWGAHTLRLGVEVRDEQDNDNLSGENRPIYAMQGIWSMVNDAPIFEQITANPNNGGLALTQRYFRSKNIAAYAQHDWKVSPNLTLNTGLRWEYFEPLHNKGFLINYPNLGPAGAELGGMTLTPHNHLWNSQWSNFGPKFGIAYTPPNLENKMVIRAGFAMAYNHLDIALFNPALEDGPNVALYNLCCGTNPADFGTPFANGSILYARGATRSPYSYPTNPALATGVNAAGFPNPFGGGTQTVEVYGAPMDIKNPLSYLFSLETQYQLAQNLTATLGYAGSVGHHYARLVNQNFLYDNANTPVFASYFAQTDSGLSYNALNARLAQTMRHGLAASVNYTYSKSMDNVSNGDLANALANQTNPANNATEWGPSDYDVKHRITATAMWEVPHVKLDSKIASALVNGWQVNGIFTWHTGFPYTPVTFNLTTSAFVPGSGVVSPTRPLAYFGGAKSGCSNDLFTNGSDFPDRGTDGTGGGAAYFNTTPPTNSHAYVPGIGRNSFRGPCYHNIDLGVAKQFAYDFGEHHTLLRLQANFFNAFNLLQLTPFTNGNSNNAANINNKYFGIAQSADAGRVIELSGRFQF